MPEGFQTVHGLMLHWFFSEESEQYQRNERGRMRWQGSVEHGSHVTAGLNWGEGGRRGGGAGSQHQRSLSQGIRTSAPAWASMVGFSLLTGAWNTCSHPAQSFGNRKHIVMSIHRSLTDKIEILGKEQCVQSSQRFERMTHFGNG